MCKIKEKLSSVLTQYSESFSQKVYTEEVQESDLLMRAFGITQELKAENKQYWGKELGKYFTKFI